LTVGDADKLIEAARKNNVSLSVVHNALFMPAVSKAKTIIQSSKIGELREMQIQQSWRDTDAILDRTHWCHQLPGGIFGEMLPHSLYLAEAFLDDLRLVKVNSLKLGTHEWIKADEVRIMLESSTCAASVTCSVNVPTIMFINFIGTKGFLHVSITRAATISHFPSGKFITQGLDNLWTSFQWVNETISVAIKHIFNQYHDGHYYVIKKYIDALKKGNDLPVSLETARKVTKLYQEVTNSIPNGK
jgi:predicted dehydrogenase